MSTHSTTLPLLLRIISTAAFCALCCSYDGLDIFRAPRRVLIEESTCPHNPVERQNQQPDNVFRIDVVVVILGRWSTLFLFLPFIKHPFEHKLEQPRIMSGITATGLKLALISSGLSVPAWAPYIPPTLLRVLPVVSSTVSLQWAVDEYQFLSSWLIHSIRLEADIILPKWFKAWGPKGTLVLFSSFPWSWGVGMANVWALRHLSWTDWRGANIWYAAGTAFSMGHMLFGPKALNLLAKIRNGEPKGRPTESLGEWLTMHATRTFLMDLPAVICFAFGATQALKVANIVEKGVKA